MTVDKFLVEFEKAEDKEKFVESLYKDTYVPYFEKVTRCNNILNSSMHIEVDGNIIFKSNTPAQFLFYSLTLISLYYDIEID